MSRFAVGDTVLCVEGDGVLVVAAYYTIATAQSLSSDFVWVRDHTGERTGPWLATRFTLVTAAPTNKAAQVKPEEGKRRWHLAPLDALELVADVFDAGDRERGGAALSWREMTMDDAARKYADALMRHTIELCAAIQRDGALGLQCRDTKSGKLVATHVAANGLILTDLALDNNEE